MQDKIFDSCVYPTSPSLYQLEILREKLKKNKIIKAVVNIRLTPDKNLSKFQSYFKNQKLFYPTYHFHNKTNLKNQLQKFKKNKIKLLKIHPRFLKKKINKNFIFYKKIFKFCEKNKINIMFCTFSSWIDDVNEFNQIDLISKLVNLTKRSNIILMHGGGSELLKVYERFRFKKNVFIDLSYTAQHFKKTSLFEDIIFLMKKFDKRLIIGSDYPSKDYQEFKNIHKQAKKKIGKIKTDNIFYKNLRKIINCNTK